MALTSTPQPGSVLNTTRDPIRNNFDLINTGFSVNHYNFGEANAGKHRFVTMPVVGAPATTATEVATYAANGTAIPELFLRRHSSGSQLPITEGLNARPGYLLTANGPNGTMMKWGIASVSGGPNQSTVVMNTGPAFGDPPYAVLLSFEHGTGATTNALNVQAVVKAGSITANQFVFYYGKSSGSGAILDGNLIVHWLAIGRGP